MATILEKTSKTRAHSASVECKSVAVMSGDEVKQFRLQLGMTQAEFAQFTGIALGTIATWEAGSSSPSSSGRAHLQSLMQRSGPIIQARKALEQAINNLKVG